MIGAALSLISLSHFVSLNLLADTTPSFCHINETFNCDAITKSPFSSFLGLPIASYGLFFYVGLLAFLVRSSDRSRVLESAASNIQFLFALIAAVLSIVLFIISKYAIGAVCLVCVGMYLVNLGLLVVTWSSHGGDSAISRISSAIETIVKFVMAIFGIGVDSSRAWSARGAALLIIVLMVATWVSPAYMMIWLQWRGTTRQGASLDSISEALRSAQYVDQWLAQPPADLNLTLRDGPGVDYSKGSPLAPVRIVEFADFECPACRRFFQTLIDLQDEFGDSLHIVYRNYPLDNDCNPSIEHIFHRGSCYASKFARCAGEQGRFWDAAEFLTTLEALEDQPTLDKAETAINGGVAILRLDATAMKECMNSKRQDEKILDDIREANALGLQSTPSVWINNRKVDKPTPQGVRAVVQYILKGAEDN